MSDCSEGSVRLTGGKHAYEGYVEVCVDGIWTHISDNGWDDIDARVVCRQLKAYGTSGQSTNSSICFYVHTQLGRKLKIRLIQELTKPQGYLM